MKAPPTAPGIAAAFPLEERPLNILTDDRLDWYKKNVFTEDFLNEYEFRSEAGRWVCYPIGSRQPVRLKELIFPPYVTSLYKNAIRQANTSVYGQLDLQDKLDCFAVSGKVSRGRDLSSVFNLPFKSSGGGKLTNEWVDLDRMDLRLTSEDDEGTRSPFIMTVHDGSTHINDLLVGKTLSDGYFGHFTGTSNVTLQAKFIIGEGEVVTGDEQAEDTKTVTTIDYRPSFMFPRSYSPEAIAPWFKEASTEDKFEMRVWPFMPMKGWCDVSSFSEVGKLADGVSGKPATLIYLTPLAAGTEWFACLAMKKELMRALRTRWLFTEKPRFLAPMHHANLANALIRATPLLWEYLAYGGVFKMLGGVNSADPVGDIVKDRLTTEDGTIYTHLVKPPKRAPSSVILSDYHREGYYFPFDRPCDNNYGTAVYRAWNTLYKDNKVGLKRLRGNLNLSKSDKKKIKVVVDSIIDAIFAGYTEDSSSDEVLTSHKRLILQMFPNETEQSIQTKYGVTLSSLKSKYTDLEWIANSIEPYEGDETSAVPSTVLTGTKTLASSEIIDKCSLSPLIYPFAPLRNTPQGKKLLALVKGTAAEENSSTGLKTDTADGIREIQGLSFQNCPKDVLVIDVDKSTAVKLKEICGKFFNHNYTELEKGTSPSDVTTWTDLTAAEAMNSGKESQKKLAFYWMQTKFQKSADDILKRIENHEDMGTNEIALVKKATSGSPMQPILEPYTSAASGASDSAASGAYDASASLYCSIFGPVKQFILHSYPKGAQVNSSFVIDTQKKFLKEIIEGLTNKPEDCPRLYFSEYINGHVLSEDKDGKVLFDIHAFVRRVKELAKYFNKTVSFKTKEKREFLPLVRRDYSSLSSN
jgi:hypothetical protein